MVIVAFAGCDSQHGDVTQAQTRSTVRTWLEATSAGRSADAEAASCPPLATEAARAVAAGVVASEVDDADFEPGIKPGSASLHIQNTMLNVERIDGRLAVTMVASGDVSLSCFPR
jgi:hypothetical protein